MLDKKQKFEIKRKTEHCIISSIFLFAGLYFKLQYGLEPVLKVILVMLVALILIDYLRIDLNIKLPIYTGTLREKEKTNLHALTFSFIAALIIFSFFEFNIAFAAMLMAVFGDAAAAVFGILIGKKRIFRKKTMSGLIAGFVVCMIMGYFFLDSLLMIFAMALTASAVESFTYRLDDNFAVPIFAAGVGHLVFILM